MSDLGTSAPAEPIMAPACASTLARKVMPVVVSSQVLTRYHDLLCSLRPCPQRIESPSTSMFSSRGDEGLAIGRAVCARAAKEEMRSTVASATPRVLATYAKVFMRKRRRDFSARTFPLPLQRDGRADVTSD